MKSIKRMIPAILIAVFLMLTVSAASAAAPTITYEFNGGQYTDGEIEIEANLYYPIMANEELKNLLFPNGMDDLSVAQSYEYGWTCGNLAEDETHELYIDTEFVDFAMWAPIVYYNGCTLEEVSALKGQEFATCTISNAQGAAVYNVVFKLKGLESLPTFNWEDDSRPEVSFVPGEKVTLVMEEPTLLEPRKVYYHLLRIESDENAAVGSERLISNHNSSTFTFTALESYDGDEFQVMVSLSPIVDENGVLMWSSNSRTILRKKAASTPTPTPAPKPTNLSLVQDFTGYQFTDGSTELYVNLMEAIKANDALMNELFPNGVMDTANARANYEYFWAGASGVHNKLKYKMHSENKFSTVSGWNGVTCSLEEASASEVKNFVGKNLITAVIHSKDGMFNVTVNFRLKELKHAPRFNYKGDSPVIVEYFPGETVIIEAPEAAIGGNTPLYYHLLHEEEQEDGVWSYGFVTDRRNSVFTLEGKASYDGYHLVPSVSLEDWETARHTWSAGVTYILKAKEIHVKVETMKPTEALPAKLAVALADQGIKDFGDLGRHADSVLKEEIVLPTTLVFEQLTRHPISNVTLTDEKGKEITEEYFEENKSLTVRLDPPAGTNVHDYTFYGVHVHEMDDPHGNRFKIGDMETLDISISGNQLCFEVSSLSPIQLYSVRKPEVVLPKTGDTTPLLALFVLMTASLAGCVVIGKRRAR